MMLATQFWNPQRGKHLSKRGLRAPFSMYDETLRIWNWGGKHHHGLFIKQFHIVWSEWWIRADYTSPWARNLQDSVMIEIWCPSLSRDLPRSWRMFVIDKTGINDQTDNWSRLGVVSLQTKMYFMGRVWVGRAPPLSRIEHFSKLSMMELGTLWKFFACSLFSLIFLVFWEFILRSSKEAHGTLHCPILHQQLHLCIPKTKSSLRNSRLSVWPFPNKHIRDFSGPFADQVRDLFKGT